MRLYAIVIPLFTIVCAGDLIAAEDVRRDIDLARQEYEVAGPIEGETARMAYVTKLAAIANKLVSRYRESGERNDEAMSVINAELKKHPAPANSDSKRLTQLLIGKWESPRRTYVFQKNGKYGSEDGSIDSDWKIKGNQLIEGTSHGTIILLNANYFIYFEGDDVFFHSRAKH